MTELIQQLPAASVWVLGFVFKLGFIADFLSRPILAGYVFGSGIIIGETSGGPSG